MDAMASKAESSKKTLPEDFFEMEIISNQPNNVELNEGSSGPS